MKHQRTDYRAKECNQLFKREISLIGIKTSIKFGGACSTEMSILALVIFNADVTDAMFSCRWQKALFTTVSQQTFVQTNLRSL